MAEVKRRKLDEIFGSIDMYFADTLYDARRVRYSQCSHLHNTIILTPHLYLVYLQLAKDGHHLFADWTPQEQKRLGLEKLFKKCFPGETYNGKGYQTYTCLPIEVFTF